MVNPRGAFARHARSEFASRNVLTCDRRWRWEWWRAGLAVSQWVSLSGVKRTWPFAPHISAYDPKRTCSAKGCDRQKVGQRSATFVTHKRSNRGKTVQAQYCSIRYEQHNGLTTAERNW